MLKKCKKIKDEASLNKSKVLASLKKSLENSHEANLEKILSELQLAHNGELDRVKVQIEEQMTLVRNAEIVNLDTSSCF